jgi:hypothetical protein
VVGTVGALVTLALLVLFWAPAIVTGAPGTPEGRTVRSLAGVIFRPLSSISRGTLFDLFSNVSEF